jgi:hypothetical protein
MKVAEVDYEHPRHALLNCIRKYAHTVQPTAKGTHGKMLQLMNENIQGDVQGVRVMLSPNEQDLYRREFVDLTPTIDKSQFIVALHNLYEMIESEGRKDNDRGHFET